MATRYWVGGSGTWNTTNTANWSETSGGAGGASAPLSTDDVVFDQNSSAGSYTVTQQSVSTAGPCRNITIDAPASGVVTFASGYFRIYGSMEILCDPSLVSIISNYVRFEAASGEHFIKTNGEGLTNVSFEGNGTWHFLGSLRSTGFSVNNGVVNTNGYNVDVINFSIASNGEMNLFESLVTWTGNVTINALATIDAGYSTFKLSDATGGFTGGGHTYHDLNSNGGLITISDAGNTFNNLKSETSSASFRFNGNTTILGSILLKDGNALRFNAGVSVDIASFRSNNITMTSETPGTQYTINYTGGSIVKAENMNITDCNATPSNTWYAGLSSTDGGNNTDWVFSYPEGRYWIGGDGNWSDTNNWSASPGGPGGASVPTSTTIVYFNSSSAVVSPYTVNIDQNVYFKDIYIDVPNTQNLSFTGFYTMYCYGHFIIHNGANVDFSSYTQTLRFEQSTYKRDILVNGTSIYSNYVYLTNATYGNNILSDLTFANASITHVNGDIRLNGYTLSTSSIKEENNSVVGVYYFDSGQVTLTGSSGNLWNYNSSSSVTAEGSKKVVFDNSTTTSNRNLWNRYMDINLFVINGGGTFSFVNGTFRYGSVDLTGFKGELTGSSASVTINDGNITFDPDMTVSNTNLYWNLGSAFIKLNNTTPFPKYINPNGVVLNLNFDIIAGEWHITDDLIMGSISDGEYTLKVAGDGTSVFDDRGYDVTVCKFESRSSVRTIVMNGNWTVQYYWYLDSTGSLTINGNKNLVFTGDTILFDGDGFNLNNVTYTGTGNFSFIGPGESIGNFVANNNPTSIEFPSSSTFYFGGFDVNGSANNLVSIIGNDTTINYTGDQRVVCDYLNIENSDALPNDIWYAGENSVDGGLNTGWIFGEVPNQKVYWVGGSGSWNTTNSANWSLTSGGAGGDLVPNQNYIAVFDSNSTSGDFAVTVTQDVSIGGILFEDTGHVMTFAGADSISLYGDLTFPSTNFTNVYDGDINLYDNPNISTPQTITTNGVTLDSSLNIISGDWELGSDLTNTGLYGFRIPTTSSGGSFDTKNYDMTVTRFQVQYDSSNVTVLLNSSNITLTAGSNPWIMEPLVNLDAGYSTLIFESGNNISLGGKTYNKILIDVNVGIEFRDGGEIKHLARDTSLLNTTQTIEFETGQTFTIGSFDIQGSASFPVTITSTDGVGQFNLVTNSPIINRPNYLTISNSAASPANTWYAGANSTNGGNNSGWVFAAAETRYWVGGTGTWDSTNTANWSLTSGGSGGASVPTSNTIAVFDNNSNNTDYTVTVSGSVNCNDIEINAPSSGTATLSGSGTMNVYGGLFIAASNVASSFGGSVYFKATNGGNIITTNGFSLYRVYFDGAGGVWDLGSALNIGTGTSNLIDLLKGFLKTNNYAVTCGLFNSIIDNVRGISLGSSTVIAFHSLTFRNVSNMSLYAGTSSININYGLNSSIEVESPLEINDLSFSNGPALTIYSSTLKVHSANNVSLGNRHYRLLSDLIVRGSITGGSSNIYSRYFLRSNSIDTNSVITINSATLSNIDFGNITVRGNVGILTGTNLGDMGNNENISFSDGKTVYRVNSSTSFIISDGYASSSGGTGDVNLFPLPQDTVIVDDNSPCASLQIGYEHFVLSVLDTRDRTTPFGMKFGFSSGGPYQSFLRGLYLGVHTYFLDSSQAFISFRAPANTVAEIYAPNTIFYQRFILDGRGTVRLISDIDQNYEVFFNSGTFDLNGYKLSTPYIRSNSSITRTLNMENSEIYLKNVTNGWNFNPTTNLTFNASGSVLTFENSSQETFSGQDLSYGTLNLAGTGEVVVYGNNSFENIINTEKNARLRFTGGLTTSVGKFDFQGDKANGLAELDGGGSTITYTGDSIVEVDYLEVTNCNVSPADTWYAGDNSVSASGTNSNWIFVTPPDIAFSVGGERLFYGDRSIECNDFYFDGTASFTVPKGTTEQRPKYISRGIVRANIDNSSLEGWNGNEWVKISGDNWTNF